MTVVFWYNSFDQVECQFSIGIPKGKVLSLKCLKTQIPKIHLKPPGKVLTVNLGHYTLETMLEHNKAFILTKSIFFKLFSVFHENCICAIEVSVSSES